MLAKCFSSHSVLCEIKLFSALETPMTESTSEAKEVVRRDSVSVWSSSICTGLALLPHSQENHPLFWSALLQFRYQKRDKENVARGKRGSNKGMNRNGCDQREEKFAHYEVREAALGVARMKVQRRLLIPKVKKKKKKTWLDFTQQSHTHTQMWREKGPWEMKINEWNIGS